ncbi:MAG: hypothetical protein M1834_008744 [Cirrosporium novae-zelandiae]|nr:MAG: hypothetical protein M1834_008744 [Cirrosporium novae-zelandiae]
MRASSSRVARPSTFVTGLDLHVPAQQLTKTSMSMADGLNTARALRVTELINDFRTLQLHVSDLVAQHPQLDALSSPTQSPPLQGYIILRNCRQEAQNLLFAGFEDVGVLVDGDGEGEKQKAELRRIIKDAARRRFLAQRIHLKARAATSYINGLAGGGNVGALEGRLRSVSFYFVHPLLLVLLSEGKDNAGDVSFNLELQELSDQQILADLRAADLRSGLWIAEDPSPAEVISG